MSILQVENLKKTYTTRFGGNLVQALSEEWALWGIRINAVNPERTKTPMRQKNFGIEPDSTLLSAERVAQASVNTLVSGLTGEVIDVRR